MHPIDEQLLHTDRKQRDLPDDKEIDKRAQVCAPRRSRPRSTPRWRTGRGRALRQAHAARGAHPRPYRRHNCYYVEELGILFTGDNILGSATSANRAAPNGDMEHTSRAAPHARLQATLFRPATDPVVTHRLEGPELIDHRGVRDQQIIALIEKGYTTDRQIRNALYPEIQPGLRRRGAAARAPRKVGRARRVTVEETASSGSRADALTPRLLRCRGPHVPVAASRYTYVSGSGHRSPRHQTAHPEPVEGLTRTAQSRRTGTGDWARQVTPRHNR